MAPLPMAPPPKSPLARYRLLSPTAAVRVSPLCLGAMNFGEAWFVNAYLPSLCPISAQQAGG